MTSATLKIINAAGASRSTPSRTSAGLIVAAAVPRHVPLRAGILHPAGTARPHAARQGPRRAHHQGGRVIGAFPGKGLLRTAEVYAKQYREIASRYIGNAAVNYFDPAQTAQRTQYPEHRGAGTARALIAEHVAAYLPRSGHESPHRSRGTRISTSNSKEYLLAGETRGFRAATARATFPSAEADVVLVEYPPFADELRTRRSCCAMRR